MRAERGRTLVVLVALIAVFCVSVGADEVDPPRDVDEWHEVLTAAVGGETTRPENYGWSLGIYPNAGVALGPPEWIAFQIHGYLSLTDGRSFSLFGGYGYERGPGSESHIATLGWGGVRRLSAARPQRGFYGKFMRYRRMRDFEHGIHHGLSVGAEMGAGLVALGFELGAARSPQNHWAITAQIGVKIAVPIIVPLTRCHGTEPDA